MVLGMGMLLGHADCVREGCAQRHEYRRGQFHQYTLECCLCFRLSWKGTALQRERRTLRPRLGPHTGLVTSRDIDMVKDRTTLLSEVMSKELVTLNARASYDDAVALLKVPRSCSLSLSLLSSPLPHRPSSITAAAAFCHRRHPSRHHHSRTLQPRHPSGFPDPPRLARAASRPSCAVQRVWAFRPFPHGSGICTQ